MEDLQEFIDAIALRELGFYVLKVIGGCFRLGLHSWGPRLGVVKAICMLIEGSDSVKGRLR